MQDLGFSQKSLQITSYLHAIPSAFLLIETSQQAGFAPSVLFPEQAGFLWMWNLLLHYPSKFVLL